MAQVNLEQTPTLRESVNKERNDRFANTQDAAGDGENLFHKTSRKGCLRVLGEVIDFTKTYFDRDLSGLVTTEFSDWINSGDRLGGHTLSHLQNVRRSFGETDKSAIADAPSRE